LEIAMPRTKKQPVQRRPATPAELEQELSAVKDQVEQLRARCEKVSRALVRLCCPPEWFKDDIDDDEVLSQMTKVPAFEDWMARISSQ
jgi:hypothetical protein